MRLMFTCNYCKGEKEHCRACGGKGLIPDTLTPEIADKVVTYTDGRKRPGGQCRCCGAGPMYGNPILRANMKDGDGEFYSMLCLSCFEELKPQQGEPTYKDRVAAIAFLVEQYGPKFLTIIKEAMPHCKHFTYSAAEDGRLVLDIFNKYKNFDKFMTAIQDELPYLAEAIEEYALTQTLTQREKILIATQVCGDDVDGIESLME